MLEEFYLSDDKKEYLYLFTMTELIDRRFIETFLGVLSYNLDKMYVLQKTEDGKEYKEATCAKELTFKSDIYVEGYSNLFDMTLSFYIYPDTPFVSLHVDKKRLDKEKTTDDDGNERKLVKEEKKSFFNRFISALEIKVYQRYAKEEAYTELALSARAYVDSGYSEEFANFEAAGCHLNFRDLYAPPQINKLPLS